MAVVPWAAAEKEQSALTGMVASTFLLLGLTGRNCADIRTDVTTCQR